KLEKAEKALDEARKGNASYRAVQGDTLASVAAKYGITVAKLNNLNPNVKPDISGKIPAGTVLQAPNDAAIAAAANKVETAKAGLKTAEEGVTKALAALKAAEDALKAAQTAEKAAKDKVKKAEEAVKVAQKELDAAKGVEGGGAVNLPTKADIAKLAKPRWDKAHSNVEITLNGKKFSFDPVSLRKPEIKDGRANWQYKERTEIFEIEGKKVAVTFKPTFSIKQSELAADGSVKPGVTPKLGVQVLAVKAA
ncbi:MAG: hypothetical protein JWM86_1069, partial [Thermoleophilia bacterium]|nr:hypothetical protein [Thermoleophilia bacterium]